MCRGLGCPHHFSISRSRTRFTFRSESRLKSGSTKGALGGVTGRRPDVSVSSQSAASNGIGARRLRDFAVDVKGEVQMRRGGGAGRTWFGFITAGDGGSSNKREEQRGDGKQLLSMLCCWDDWDCSLWGEAERSGERWAGDLRSETLTEPEREAVKGIRH